MARPLRIEFDGAWYHVMNRGAGHRRVFRTVGDRRGFLDLLGVITETFGVETHAYCLMDNHYHLVLHTPRGNLGRAMRHLGGLFTQRANRLAASDGPLFRGRYKAILVDADSYLAQLSRYIHRNPVEAGITADPSDFPWSSFAAYLGTVRAPHWLVLRQTLDLFGRADARQRYADFVRQEIDAETAAFYGSGRLDPVLGGDRFRSRIERRLRSPAPAADVPDLRRVAKPPDIARVVELTAREFGAPASQLATAVRGRVRRNVPRMVAIGLSRTVGGHPLAAIADAFGIGHYASVSNLVRQFLELSDQDRQLAKRIGRLKEQLAERE